MEDYEYPPVALKFKNDAIEYLKKNHPDLWEQFKVNYVSFPSSYSYGLHFLDPTKSYISTWERFEKVLKDFEADYNQEY